MKVVVINGTEVKGCTYRIKEAFLKALENCEITEYYLPKDLPEFCVGCKTCFFKDENLCPHSEYTMPIWNSIIAADLIVFSYPVYGLRAPGQVKTLLDHFCCHWMVHRPEKEMFLKHAVILTNSIGASNKAAQKDVKTSLNWLGVSSVKCLAAGLMEGVIWNELSDKKKKTLLDHAKKLGLHYHSDLKQAKKNLKIALMFTMSKMIHKGILKSEEVPSADNVHWINMGWIEGKG